MTTQEKLAACRAMEARMTRAPWSGNCGLHTVDRHQFIADGPRYQDLDGIATMRNEYTRLLALVEALVAEREIAETETDRGWPRLTAAQKRTNAALAAWLADGGKEGA